MGAGSRVRPGLVLLALGCFAAAASGQCIIGLSVDGQRSRLTAGGQLIQPLPEPIIVNSTQQMSLSGKLFLSIPSGPCPTTPQAFVQALAGASIVTPADADLPSLQPTALQAQIGDPALADLTLYGIQFNLSSPALPAIPTNAAKSSYGTTLYSQVANGSSSVQLSQSMPIATSNSADTSVEMGDMTTNSTVTISVAGRGNVVQLTFVKYNFTYVSQFQALGLQGEASYWFAGSIQTSATLGCQQCGVHGTCTAGNGQPSCVCDCGFTGPDCGQSAPDPACPRPSPAAKHAAQAPVPVPAQAPVAAAPAPAASSSAGVAAGAASAAGAAAAGGAAAAATPVLPSAGASLSPPPPSPAASTTAAGQPQSSSSTSSAAGGSDGASGLGGISALSAGSFGPDPSTDPKNGIAVCQHGASATCDACQAGWEGANCDACVTDKVCAATLDDSKATCNTGLLYTKKTVYKSYVCDFSQTILSNLLTPQRGYWIECNTTQVRDSKGLEGGVCKVGLRLKAYADNPIQCVATACQFKADSGKIQCRNAQCACQQGACPDGANSYLGMINGKDVGADCDPSTGDCNIQIQDFPLQLQTPCKAGDCISDKNPTLNQGTFTSHSRDYSSVIAAIPILALLALCLLAGVVSLMGAAFQTAKHKGTPKAAGGMAGTRGSRAPRNPIHLLRFENVTCAVPGSRFNDSHWSNTAGATGQRAGHGRPVGPGLAAKQADAMEDGTPYKRYENGTFQQEHGEQMQDSARQPLPGQVGHCDYSPEGSEQVREPSLFRRKMLWMSGLRHRMCSRRPRVNIVDNATGQAKMGELVGVLGPSGCGKTTLLSILCGSVSSLSGTSRVYGHITLDGRTRKAWASRLVAYVPQSDFLLPTLTVAESLRYSAQLRLPEGTQGQEVQARVEGVLEELGLQHVAGSQVGGSSGIRGVSGGERRRVTIGMELVIDPSIIILDEPTSGLDSFTAVNLMTTLKQVAQTGRIVLLSFHQPSPAMYELLDRAFLMAKGHIVFCGEPGAAYEHFEHAGLPCPNHTAIAEHMLAAVSDPTMSQCLINHVDRKGPYAGIAREEFLGGPNSRSASKLDDSQKGWSTTNSLAHTKPPRTPITRELAVLYKRTFTEIIRNPTLLLMHCVMALIMGLLCGGIFWHISNDIAGAQNRLGAVFFSLVFLALTSLTTVDLLVNERGLVVKEAIGGYYRPVSYYLSKATLDGLLLRVLPAVIYSIPFYPMIRFQSDPAHVALFFCVLAVFSATVGALSMAITVGFGTAGKAALIMNLVLLLSLLFTGYLVNIAAVTPVLQWVHYLSVFFFGFESLIVNEMSGISLIFSAAGASITIKGDLFLQLISVRTDMLLRDVAILDAYFFFFVISGIALLYLTMPRALVMRRPHNREGAYAKSAGEVSHVPSSSSVGVIDVQHSDDNSESGWDERRLDSHAIDMTPQKETEFTPQKTYGR